jgi:hypothetical protein
MGANQCVNVDGEENFPKISAKLVTIPTGFSANQNIFSVKP